MRCSTPASLLVLAAVARAAPSIHVPRQAVQCAPTDKGGTPLVSSDGSDNFVTCTYSGAGPCTYFPANGSFSSGSSQCPAGIAQNPSATTDALSSVGGGATGATTSTAALTATTSTAIGDPVTSTDTLPTSIPPSTPTSLPVTSPGTSVGVSAPVNSDTTPTSSAGSGSITTPTPTPTQTEPAVTSASVSPTTSSNAARGLATGTYGAGSAVQAVVVFGALLLGAFVL
ncbi:hypothetical protein DFH07DRAFT_798852 [Mycena maculata]|uniref:Uncharacterized protein n=1 Tax=Mycena maculata TaxID=230809 RepID=A0AAD7K0M0_9AGAR|nr:hypothetical protein DFH07DRAFT_798852 [Mycena maculata]